MALLPRVDTLSGPHGRVEFRASAQQCAPGVAVLCDSGPRVQVVSHRKRRHVAFDDATVVEFRASAWAVAAVHLAEQQEAWDTVSVEARDVSDQLQAFAAKQDLDRFNSGSVEDFRLRDAVAIGQPKYPAEMTEDNRVQRAQVGESCGPGGGAVDKH